MMIKISDRQLGALCACAMVWGWERLIPLLTGPSGYHWPVGVTGWLRVIALLILTQYCANVIMKSPTKEFTR